MAEAFVKIEVDQQGIASVTLNRPDVRNAFDDRMIAQLDRGFADLAGRVDVAAVVLRGAGKSFSAGADLGWMERAASYTEAQNYDDALALATMLNRLYTLPKPVIAVVHGAAMGGGLGLVACCDIVLADAHTVFALSEVKLGLIPATIAPYVLRAIGERAFRRYAVTGERFDGRMAKAMGLAHEVAETEEGLQPLLEAMLKQLSANGISAMTESKRLAINLAGRPVDAALMEDTARRIASTRAGAEAKEGLTAFFEKRKPGWVRN